jgi:hypothetical protein
MAEPAGDDGAKKGAKAEVFPLLLKNRPRLCQDTYFLVESLYIRS